MVDLHKEVADCKEVDEADDVEDDRHKDVVHRNWVDRGDMAAVHNLVPVAPRVLTGKVGSAANIVPEVHTFPHLHPFLAVSHLQ